MLACSPISQEISEERTQPGITSSCLALAGLDSPRRGPCLAAAGGQPLSLTNLLPAESGPPPELSAPQQLSEERASPPHPVHPLFQAVPGLELGFLGSAFPTFSSRQAAVAAAALTWPRSEPERRGWCLCAPEWDAAWEHCAPLAVSACPHR